MSVETLMLWPEERRLAREGLDPTQAYFARMQEEVRDALKHPPVSDEAVEAVEHWLRVQRDSKARLPDRNEFGEALMQALEQAGCFADAACLRETSHQVQQYDDVSPAEAALAARAVVLLLSKEPNEHSWRLMSDLRHRGNRLSSAVNEVLEKVLGDEAFRERFFLLAESLVSSAVAAPERQVISGEREMFGRLLNEWRSKPTLTELWFGLRGLNYVRYYGPEGEILRDVARLDPSRFINLLERFDNPYQAWSAIEASGAANDFNLWRDLVETAPVAFRPDGSWTGAVVLPLLLVVAAQAVAQGAAPFARHATVDAAETAERDVRDVAEGVAAVLLERQDGPPAALRWAAWLARGLTSASAEGPPTPTDARDRAFTPWQLLVAVAQRAGPDIWRHLVPPDLPGEEVWFTHMAKVVSIPQLPASALDYAALLDAFTSQWPGSDDPEIWHGEPGARLRVMSSLVRTFARQPTTLGVRLLAIPLAMSPDPVATWMNLWRRTLVLRETVEFAPWRLSASSADDNVPRAALELSWLVLDIGLCVLDQVADERIALPYERSVVAAGLLPLLWDGLSEMYAIDRFEGEIWDRARQHLVLRRALFAADREDSVVARVFSSEVNPTLANMLSTMAAVERPFFSTLLILLDAGMSADELLSALERASIDLSWLLDAAERANIVDERRPVASSNELERLRKLSGASGTETVAGETV